VIPPPPPSPPPPTPITAVFKPGQSSDDCYAYNFGYKGGIHMIWPAQPYLDFGAVSEPRDTGIRFVNVTIPKGATILTAKVTFNSYYTVTSQQCNVRIKGEDADDPATFSTYDNFFGRVRTSQYVDWSAIPSWTANTDYDSPDITNIVQAIVNRPGFANHLVIFIEDNGSLEDVNRYPKSYDNTTALCPRLTVTWII
jgi:hypothetical protein